MAIAEEALYSYLAEHAGVKALCAERIYPLRAPDAAVMPYIVYRRVSSNHVASHSGNSGLSNPRFQLDCYAEDYLQAKQLAEQCVSALHGHKGGNIQAAFVEDENDLIETDTNYYRVAVDVKLWHTEA